MAGNEILDGDEIELDPPQVDEDSDDIAAILRRSLASMKGEDSDDEDHFAAPMEEKESPVVSVEDGLQLIDKADKPTAQKSTPAQEAPPETGKAEAADEGAADSQPAPDADDIGALLDGIDPDRAARIRERIEAGGALTALLSERKDQISAIAETPEKAIGNLLHLHDYANKNPDQYLAWAAWQLGGEKAIETLTKAAGHLGLKVVAAEEEDPFEDDRTKALREENAALRQQANGGRPVPFGPDVQQPQDQVAAFAGEKGQDGKLLRPFWNDLAPIIGQRALQQRNDTGKPVTTADLARIYTEEEARMRERFGGAVENPPRKTNVAAPAAGSVADQDGNKHAAPSAIDRARAASKHIDGGGQGADRHSAPPDDSIASLIRWNMSRTKAG